MGNDEFILYIRKNYNCSLTNDRLGRMIGNWIYIANYNVFKGRHETPAEEKLWLASLDAGHCSQNVYLYCASEGLKCVVRASADKAALLRLLQLNENYQFIVAQTIGY